MTAVEIHSQACTDAARGHKCARMAVHICASGGAPDLPVSSPHPTIEPMTLKLKI